MSDESLALLTVQELAGKIQKREVSPVEVTGAVLARIERLNPQINAFTTVVGDRARDAARAAEKEIIAGRYRGPFHGIPVGIKDLTDTAGIRTTYGSDSFKDYVPAEDAEIVRRLKEAGAVILGKTATHEIGMGVTTNNPYFGPTRNPWNTQCIPGGSSGGSGAAIAADMAILCSGNDGGGSIRIPACFCGVVGVKPTLGLISRFGLMTGVPPSSFVVEGPLGKTVTDCALALQLWAGVDPRDPFTQPVPIPDYVAALQGRIEGMKVGISSDLFLTPVDPEVQVGYERTLKILQEAGATLHEVRLPHTKRVAENFSQVVDGELALWHKALSRLRPVSYSPEVSNWVDQALAVTLEDHLSGQVYRVQLRQDYLMAFAQVDILVGPTQAFPAPKIGLDRIALGGQEHDLLTVVLAYTAASNLTDMPAISLPVGFSKEGLPIGMQVIAPHFEESRALRVARVLEDALTDVRQRKPVLRDL